MTIVSFLALFLALLAPAQCPLTITATEDDSANFPGAPQVEGPSFGQWQGRWVFIGGRIAGYHGVGMASADFPRADANRDVWVVDTTVKPAKTYHVPVADLPASFSLLKDEWISNGQLSYQDGSSLYIAGGYGQDSSGHWVTYPVISKVDLPRLIQGVMQGHLPAQSICFGTSPLVQSAGGEMQQLSDGYVYLVMGHVFTGNYTAFEGQGEHNAAAVSQIYLNEIRKLKIAPAKGSLSVTLVTKFTDDNEFHRRDLNITKTISPSGVGLAVYGGVFTPDTQLGYSKPIYLSPNGKPVVDSTFEQKLNAYNCAKLVLYDRNEQAMYTTFFGGISRYSWDPKSQSYIENARSASKSDSNYLDGLQWSDQISTLRRVMVSGNPSTSETVQPVDLPGFVGTDALFIPAAGVAQASEGTDILDLGPLRGKKTMVGYLYGGIQAYPFRFPYNKTAQPYNAGTVPTKPSDLILKVYVEAGKS
jgi:hypothetical protein